MVVCRPNGECFAVDYFSNGATVGFAALGWVQHGTGHNCFVEGFRFHLDDIPHS